MAEGLVLKDLHKVYGRRGKPDVHAVRGINLAVRDGELLALLGPSGCGKSTTLRMIVGLEEVSSGDILIGGSSIVGLPPHRRNIALAFETYALYPPLTVEENITFGIQARKERDAKRRAREIAERLGITDILHLKPASLSSGQKQRVSLARAVVRQPAVLLLDEPLSHLDLAQRSQTRRELKRLQAETGYTTVLVTHDQLEAISMADRIALMNDGLIQQVGTPEEIYDDPKNLFVAGFVGDPPMNLIPGRIETKGGFARVALSREILLDLQNATAKDGQEVIVGIRPQDISVVNHEGSDVLKGTVFAYEPLQESGLLTIGLPGVDLRIKVQTSPDVGFERGDLVRLKPNPALTHLFDANSGERIR
ncbi:MAG: ABC transporter ATP-binding protein [Rubrobacteraceae bacterium]|nr:ABC transporter ATP-binding protein [Rubrobacteraceae bacterium]